MSKMFNDQKDKILRLPFDRSKRHFVVGDIHGRFETFMALLESADYDPLSDIIYGVGDLIDRGPKSFEAVDYFDSMENAYTVLGNHEYMACSEQYQRVWLNNGGLTCMASLGENNKDQEWLTDTVSKLPWVIEVGEDDEEGAFRIVHAEYPISWTDETIAVQVEKTFNNVSGLFLAENNYGMQSIIWARDLITEGLNNVANLKPIAYEMEINPNRKRHNYVGHTPIRKITTVVDNTFVDTWGSGTMSMIEVVSGDQYRMDYKDDD